MAPETVIVDGGQVYSVESKHSAGLKHLIVIHKNASKKKKRIKQSITRISRKTIQEFSDKFTSGTLPFSLQKSSFFNNAVMMPEQNPIKIKKYMLLYSVLCRLSKAGTVQKKEDMYLVIIKSSQAALSLHIGRGPPSPFDLI